MAGRDRLKGVVGVKAVEVLAANRYRLMADRDALAAAAARRRGSCSSRRGAESEGSTPLSRLHSTGAQHAEGSALRGVGVVMLKELVDHFTSVLVVSWWCW
jgi:hypothetical protein